MKSYSILSVAVIGVAALFGAGHDYKLEQKEPVHHTFPANKVLDVDLVNGSLTVVGDGGSTIRVEGERMIRAESQQDIDQAKRDVTLDMNEKDGTAQIFENGPFRDNNRSSGNHGFHDRYERRYEVSYQITVHIPRATELVLRSVNGGVKTQNTNGKFDVHSVNGPLEMSQVVGTGKADVVNGPVTVAFLESPKADSSFRSVNGRIEVTLPVTASADMSFKTVNGQAYTDFESTMMAAQPVAAEQKNGKFIYRTHGMTSVRVGSGGPEAQL